MQAVVLNITDQQHDYVAAVVGRLKTAGFRVEADFRNEKIGFKIREAEKAKVPFMLVAGNREMQDETLSVRGRSGSNLGNKTVAEVVDLLRAEITHNQRDLQHTH